MTDDTGATILIVDDSEERLHALERLLLKQGYQVELTRSGENFLEILPTLAVDLVLLDVMLPGITGLEVLQALRTDHRWDTLPILLISSALISSDAQAEGIELGAIGYIAWPMPNREFLARVALAIRQTNLETLSPTVTPTAQVDRTDSQALTPRQREVVSLIAQGLSCKAIALQLSISVRTAETHRADAMKRLGLHNTAELVSFAHHNQLT